MKDSAGQTRIRKFFSAVTTDGHAGAHRLLLDGRPAKTRGRAFLAAPSKALAEAIADEWRSGDEWIEIDAMPLTKLAWTVIDLGAGERASWRDVILNYAGTDLVCYRAAEPSALVDRQAEVWDPFLDWAREEFGAALCVTSGIAAIAQPATVIEAIGRRLESADAWTLAGIKSAAEISGSAVLALALEARAFSAGEIFDASRLDERFQQERWGSDAEAAGRERGLWRDFLAVDRWFSLLKSR